MQKTKRYTLFLILFLMISCRNNNSVTILKTTETESVVIRFAISELEQARYQPLINTYEEENPNIKIETIFIEEVLELSSPDDINWPEESGVRLISAADVVGSSAIGINSLPNQFLLDLQPLMEADTSFDPNDFYPNLLEQFERDNRIWALPSTANLTLIFFNKD